MRQPSRPKAFHDQRFLESRDARSLRILAEYLEPLSRFERHGVKDTIVFMGSARLLPRDAAQAALAKAEATGQGVDPLGFYVPPFVYAAMEVLEQAIFKTGSLDQGALAATLHQGTFPTLVPLHRGFDRLNLHSQ